MTMRSLVIAHNTAGAVMFAAAVTLFTSQWIGWELAILGVSLMAAAVSYLRWIEPRLYRHAGPPETPPQRRLAHVLDAAWGLQSQQSHDN